MLGADPIVFPVAFAAFYAAHEVADHWVQRHTEALGKGAAGWRGRWMCARHVTALTIVKAAALAVVVLVLGVVVNPVAVAVALGVDAVSHYWADRRTTLMKLARLIGKSDFATLGDGATAPTGTGAYALDQSWHIGWLTVAALLASLGVS